ncbi:hypothetical protein IFR05_005210 [Cadophora sp. M221]|nr:hypothetical protein IFR05_005210 [Cadophora sp. M221]
MANSETDIGALSMLTLENSRPDHNLNSRFKRWYIRFPQHRSKDDPDHLSANDYVELGPFSEIKKETTCKICRLITGTIEMVITHSPRKFIQEREDEGSVDFVLSKWYLSPSMVCMSPHGQSYQLFLVPNIFDAQRSGSKAHTHSSWPFGLRLLGSNPRHGRRVPHDQVDFAWLKETMDQCDGLTKMPPRDFHPKVRVVDVKDMRIVELPDQQRYVTLSYAWGGVVQLKLRKENESALRQSGSLTKRWDEIPRTIQDFFTLVAKVDERYAWVDSLSILQDDDAEALEQQMSQMGEIYRHSHFTVHSVSGSVDNSLSEFTERHLTYQKDALKAFLGVQDNFRLQCASASVHGLPEGEFEAALLWSPIGTSERRYEVEPGVGRVVRFPSWSWLGWIGPVAWPWQMERDTFLSMVNVPLLWRDAGSPLPIPRTGPPDGTIYSTASGPTYSTYNPWFTSNEMCLPASPTRGQTLQDIALGTDDHLGVLYECLLVRMDRRCVNDAMVQWPNGGRPILRHASPFSHIITFRALTTRIFVIGEPWQRKRRYNMKHTVYRMSIVDGEGVLAGYIDVPYPAYAHYPIKPVENLFVVLWRSTIDGKFETPPDALEAKRREMLSPLDRLLNERHDLESYVPEVVHLNEQGNFDEDVYDKGRPWCMFNVMMVDVGEEGLMYRRTIGRIHVDAVLTSNGGEPLPWGVVDLA